MADIKEKLILPIVKAFLSPFDGVLKDSAHAGHQKKEKEREFLMKENI